MKIRKFNESEIHFDLDLQKLANEIRTDIILMDIYMVDIIIDFNIDENELSSNKIDNLIEKLKELKNRLEAKKYNL